MHMAWPRVECIVRPADAMYWVYIVASPTGTLYTGVTGNLERRAAEHRSRVYPGFASKYGCTRLVFAQEFECVRDALETEKRIKGWKRCRKVALIEASNPSWADMAAPDV